MWECSPGVMHLTALRKAKTATGTAYTRGSKGASTESEQGCLSHKHHASPSEMDPGADRACNSEKWNKDKVGK